MSLNESIVEVAALAVPDASLARFLPLEEEKPEATQRDPAVAGLPKLLSGELSGAAVSSTVRTST